MFSFQFLKCTNYRTSYYLGKLLIKRRNRAAKIISFTVLHFAGSEEWLPLLHRDKLSEIRGQHSGFCAEVKWNAYVLT